MLFVGFTVVFGFGQALPPGSVVFCRDKLTKEKHFAFRTYALKFPHYFFWAYALFTLSHAWKMKHFQKEWNFISNPFGFGFIVHRFNGWVSPGGTKTPLATHSISYGPSSQCFQFSVPLLLAVSLFSFHEVPSSQFVPVFCFQCSSAYNMNCQKGCTWVYVLCHLVYLETDLSFHCFA